MSLFDFPRINFAGNIDINVPTINNSVYFPLTMYDQMRSKPLFPPRLYFTNEAKAKAVTPSINPKIIPDTYNGYVYIEIEPINDINTLRQWCTTPLGDFPADKAYIPYYNAAINDLGPQGLLGLGKCPGYWNMYGDMGVTMSNVNVAGVQVFDGTNVNTYTAQSPNVPADALQLLNAGFDMNIRPGQAPTTACMVEGISSQSSFANVFCSNVNLFDNTTKDILFSGCPTRFAALIYSGWRVLNWFPAMAGSGRFCAAISFDDYPEAANSPLAQFFVRNKNYDPRPLKGIFLTFEILEVFENRYNQNIYINNPNTKNPAQATTFGSITPWYDGDMKTGIMGRNLIALGQQPWYTNTNSIPNNPIPIACVPPIASLKDLGNGTAIFSVDMGNTWPEAMTPPFVMGGFQPIKRGDATFETMNLGTVSLRYGADPSTEICNLKINPTDNPRTKVFQQGGVFDFLITNATVINNIKNNYISGILNPANGSSPIQILQESIYMISSDQKGCYSNEGDLASLGYYVNSAKRREQCRLRIFQKGVPVTTPVIIYRLEYRAPEAGNDPQNGVDTVVPLLLKDNDIVPLADGVNNSNAPLQMVNNAMYYFVYDQQYPNNQFPPFTVNNNYSTMDTGSFVVLRVHPSPDYSKYLDKNHPDYTPPTFDVIYKEILQLYDVVYPIMALIHPFTDQEWNNGTMAGMLAQRIQFDWNDIRYMPRSREMGDNQKALLMAWANTFNA